MRRALVGLAVAGLVIAACDVSSGDSRESDNLDEFTAGSDQFSADGALGSSVFPLRHREDPSTLHLAQGEGCPNSTGYLQNQYHLGVDLAAPVGEEVFAVADGEVSFRSYDEEGWGPSNGALFIRHQLADGTPFVAVYGHIRPTVSAGPVGAGDPIGTVGSYSLGSHLHLAIRPGTEAPFSPAGMMRCDAWPDENGTVDPLTYLGWGNAISQSGTAQASDDAAASNNASAEAREETSLQPAPAADANGGCLSCNWVAGRGFGSQWGAPVDSSLRLVADPSLDVACILHGG